MKRILMGIVWFIVCYLAFLLLASLVLGVFVWRGLPADANLQQGSDAVTAYMSARPGLMSGLRWGIFLAAVLAAASGTLKGVLPGTKKPT
jgi:hypothetical protein